MISLTKRAIAKVKEISDSEGIGHYIIRASVKGGGCAGFVNDLCFDDVISELDEVFMCDDVKLVIDPVSTQYLEDTEIDYIDSPFSGGFKFLNPNVTGSCGCGHSQKF